MEAADDICYKILDIEDALELEILRFEDVSEVFKMLAGSESTSFLDPGKKYSARRRVPEIRSKAIDNLIKKVTNVFVEEYEDIISGSFKGDLISQLKGVERDGLSKAKELTTENIFLHRRKIELELGSYETLDRILKAFVDAANEVKSGSVSFKSQRVLDLMGPNKFDSTMSHHQCYLRITDLVSGMTDNHATHVANQLLGRAL